MIGSETVLLHKNDTHFAKLRAYDRISPGDVGPAQFSFAELASGGGKGGNPMQATRDRRLIIKQLYRRPRCVKRHCPETRRACHIGAVNAHAHLLALFPPLG